MAAVANAVVMRMTMVIITGIVKCMEGALQVDLALSELDLPAGAPPLHCAFVKLCARAARQMRRLEAAQSKRTGL